MNDRVQFNMRRDLRKVNADIYGKYIYFAGKIRVIENEPAANSGLSANATPFQPKAPPIKKPPVKPPTNTEYIQYNVRGVCKERISGEKDYCNWCIKDSQFIFSFSGGRLVVVADHIRAYIDKGTKYQIGNLDTPW